jgi:hypothetical protein
MVTLTAVDTGNPLWTDSEEVMPSERILNLPLLFKSY